MSTALSHEAAPPKPLRSALRLGPISLPINPRLLIAGAITTVLAFLVFCANIAFGDFPLTIADVIRVLLGGGTAVEERVVLDIRLGRAVAGLCVGAALAFSGAITQTIARNPLASPDVLGITQGASVAAVLVIGFAGTATTLGTTTGFLLNTLGIPLIAVIGAMTTAIVVWVLAGKQRGSVLRLVLIGVGASMFLMALTTWIVAVIDIDRAGAARVWLTGSLNGRDLTHAWAPMIALLIAFIIGGWLAFNLAALSLGEASAHVLGHNVRLAQAVQLLIAVVLAALAVSAAGPIGFVAFVTPQIAVRIAGTATPPMMYSAVCGALLVSCADLLARVVLPWELPVGVITAFFGAPVLLYLILRLNRKATI